MYAGLETGEQYTGLVYITGKSKQKQFSILCLFSFVFADNGL